MIFCFEAIFINETEIPNCFEPTPLLTFRSPALHSILSIFKARYIGKELALGSLPLASCPVGAGYNRIVAAQQPFQVYEVISDKIQQISDIFQQNISDIFQQTDISMIKSGNRHFGHIQAYFFGLIQHALQELDIFHILTTTSVELHWKTREISPEFNPPVRNFEKM